MTENYKGEVKIVAFGFPPRGWAFCDGAILPIAQNTDLFSLLGITYGGDGKNTFGLPDLRGRVPVHQDEANAFPIGAKGGEAAHALDMAEMPVSHTHVAQGSQNVGGSNLPNGEVLAVTGLNAYAAPDPAQPIAQGTVSVAGGTPHENMSPYQVLNFCIALVGVHPPRQ